MSSIKAGVRCAAQIEQFVSDIERCIATADRLDLGLVAARLTDVREQILLLTDADAQAKLPSASGLPSHSSRMQ